MGKILSPPLTVAFDVYGTLVDPLAMHEHLATIVGADRAEDAAALWRRTQLEYSFRRGLMGPEHYVDFDRCTAQALRFMLASYRIDPDNETARALLAAYRTLPAFPDTLPGLRRVRDAGHHLLAFSNGPEASVRAVLDHAAILPMLDGVVSVDDLRTFKPNPAVYSYLVERGGRDPDQTWLVTANAWDAIGAKAAGLRVAWLRRNPAAIFDPWEDDFAPDMTVGGLQELRFRVGVRPGSVNMRPFVVAHVREHNLGTVFAAETGFIFSRDPDTVLAPDVAFVRADRLPPEDTWEGFLELTPDLVVEVISPSDTASRVLSKVLMYLDAGTQLVITLDPIRQVVVVYGQDRVCRILTASDTLDCGDVLPGFRLPLADLFA